MSGRTERQTRTDALAEALAAYGGPPCTHSATADGITQQCAEPAGHHGPHSWEYTPRMETAHNLRTPQPGAAVAS